MRRLPRRPLARRACPSDLRRKGAKVTRRTDADMPQGATACYLNLFDERGLISSNEHLELVSE